MRNRGTYGKRCYTCADCGTKVYMDRQDARRHSAFRLQCQNCGSYYLDESKPGKAENQDHGAQARAAQEEGHWLNKDKRG